MASLLASVFHQYANSVVAFDDAQLLAAFIPISLLDAFNAVMAGVTIRAVMRTDTHWFRLLIITWLLSVGGTTIIAIVAGGRPAWWTLASTINGILVGYWLSFHCPGDAFHRYFLSGRPVKRVLPFLVAASMAIGMSFNTVERALADPTLVAEAPVHTYLMLSFLGGCGGGLLVEFLNLFNLPRQQFRVPAYGASTGVLHSLFGALAHVLLFRDPARLGVVPALARALGIAWTGGDCAVGPCSPLDAKHAAAALALFLTVLGLVPSARFNRTVHGWLNALPGWHSTLVPSQLDAVLAPSSSEDASKQAAGPQRDVLGYAGLPNSFQDGSAAPGASGPALVFSAFEVVQSASAASALASASAVVAPAAAPKQAEHTSPARASGGRGRAASGIGRQGQQRAASKTRAGATPTPVRRRAL
jgi:hypothetical protein